MKKTIFIMMVFLTLLVIQGKSAKSENNFNQEGQITLICSPALENLTNNWVVEYGKGHPEIKFTIQNLKENKSLDEYGKPTLGIFSGIPSMIENGTPYLEVVIGRDVIVPVINRKNPFFDQVNSKGISPERLALLLMKNHDQNWGELIEGAKDSQVHLFVPDDDHIINSLATFLGIGKQDITGKLVSNETEMIRMVQNDPYAIGFCRVNDILNSGDRTLAENIKFLPIDRNNNGRIDSFEKIYDNILAFNRAVWIGKYPKELITNIYAVVYQKPENEQESSFLKWLITDGQQYLNQSGYSELVYSERQAKLDKLFNPNELPNASDGATLSFMQILLLILLVVLLIGAITQIAYFVRKRKDHEVIVDPPVKLGSFGKNTVEIPGGLFFDKSHTWAYIEKDGVLRIGLDDFIQRLMGPVTAIKMKKAGDEINKGEVLFTLIQRGKQLNIKSPVSGIISDVNRKLAVNASLINSDPYSDGWIYVIEPRNWSREIQFMFMPEKFKSFLVSEFTRLKDFLSQIQTRHDKKLENIILQEGGEIKEGILMNFDPEEWEDFQTHFIDSSI